MALDQAKTIILQLLDHSHGPAPPSLAQRHQLATSCRQLLLQQQQQQQHSPSGDGDGGPDEEAPGPVAEGLQLLWGALIEQQYLLAVDLLLSSCDQSGWQSRAADIMLHQLGLSWRLADTVWGACWAGREGRVATAGRAGAVGTGTAKGGGTSGGTGTLYGERNAGRPVEVDNGSSAGVAARTVAPALRAQPLTTAAPHPAASDPPLVLDPPAALPAPTFTALQRAFAPTSPFWSDHAYGHPTTPFFSYVYDLSLPPGSVVEAAAQALRTHPLLAARLEGVTHVEWWAHIRAAPSGAGGAPGHQLHFDCDETLLRKGEDVYRLRHPLYSSVLYLSTPASSSAGPTLVLDQVPGQDGLAGHAWAVQPLAGRYLVFPGNLLHGVLPGPPKSQEGSDKPGGVLPRPPRAQVPASDPLGPKGSPRLQEGALTGSDEPEEVVAPGPPRTQVPASDAPRQEGPPRPEEGALTGSDKPDGVLPGWTDASQADEFMRQGASGVGECEHRTTLMLAWWVQEEQPSPPQVQQGKQEVAGPRVPQGAVAAVLAEYQQPKQDISEVGGQGQPEQTSEQTSNAPLNALGDQQQQACTTGSDADVGSAEAGGDEVEVEGCQGELMGVPHLRPWMIAPVPTCLGDTGRTEKYEEQGEEQCEGQSEGQGEEQCEEQCAEQGERQCEGHAPSAKRARLMRDGEVGLQDDVAEASQGQSWLDLFHALMIHGDDAIIHSNTVHACSGLKAGDESLVWSPEPITPAWCEVRRDTTAVHQEHDDEQTTCTAAVQLPADMARDVLSANGAYDVLPADVARDVLPAAMPDLRFFLPDADLFNRLYPVA